MMVNNGEHKQAGKPRSDKDDSGVQSLNTLIKESNNPQAAQLKKEIDDLRKERSKLITRIKESRRRLGYKEAESTAIERLLTMRKNEDKDGAKRRRIGYLKRMKAKLEFRISTEASSLTQEKDIIRKINEINGELGEALAAARLERKTEFIKKDIEDYRNNIMEINTKLQELDTRLDAMYVGLRKALGIGSWQNKQQQQQQKPRKSQQSRVQEINLEDIAVIKKKDAK
ncbi:MAG: hypothetical protein ABSE71_01330 [Candidatus Micrarchaeaceae archaeon]|nr:hypothetical protein [Candidatus Micrarchaeota archaeon]